MHRFARPVPQLRKISNLVLDFSFNNSGHLLTPSQQNCLSQQHLEHFANIENVHCMCLVTQCKGLFKWKRNIYYFDCEPQKVEDYFV